LEGRKEKERNYAHKDVLATPPFRSLTKIPHFLENRKDKSDTEIHKKIINS
jgi:hypothetical protein